ncbi:MAG TPA: universal stress protein [Spirillospora sp.]|nr:universal stress protein [Spirillospora sp.]
MYQTILVPLDGSARAERILPHVEELAQRFRARVVLLRVAAVEEPVHVPLELKSTIDAQVERNRIAPYDPYVEARSYLESKCARLQGQNIQADMRVQEGPVVQTIIDVAKSENADLIAMSSHGRTGLERVFYGSVTAGVLHRADRPVLVIRARDGD